VTNMPFVVDNVVHLHLVRQYKPLRQRLILEWKNPLLNVNELRFQREKQELARQILRNPQSLELRVKWQLLREVECG
jgi:hypothetical protein